MLALVLVLGEANQASAALYVGGGHGSRFTFRLKGHRVVSAEVSTHLYCRTRPGNKREIRPEELGYANAENPLRIDADGIFRQIERPGVQGDAFSTETALIGHVGPRLIKGQFEYSYVVSEEAWEECQTNRFPYGPAQVTFRARRVG